MPEKVGRGFRSRFDTHGRRGKKGDGKNLGLQFQERFSQADGDSSQSHLLESSISLNGPALVPHRAHWLERVPGKCRPGWTWWIQGAADGTISQWCSPPGHLKGIYSWLPQYVLLLLRIIFLVQVVEIHFLQIMWVPVQILKSTLKGGRGEFRFSGGLLCQIRGSFTCERFGQPCPKNFSVVAAWSWLGQCPFPKWRGYALQLPARAVPCFTECGSVSSPHPAPQSKMTLTGKVRRS